MKQNQEPLLDQKMVRTDFTECMQQSYLDYSMSVITARALPDIRDGLKPVQRRTLYAMYELGLHYDKPHRKCARIVGDTMGKYHPHGDSSIYDALVVMSQDFKKNQPLAEPHGNFGSIEGDGAAAMRYTEARLHKLTEMVYLADLDKDVVDFIPNFDETEKEPSVLPVRIPNLLVNGAEGIAVGMTTNIPSHNLYEVLECVKAYIDRPSITTRELLEIMPGPDFSTGGIVANQEDLLPIYETGNGKLRLRGKVEFEPGRRKVDKDKLVVTEIPYTMIGDGIRKFLMDTAALAEGKKLPEVTDISNESSKEGIRIVIELKKGSDPERVKNILFKKTKLEDTFGVNMIAIHNGRPVLFGLRDLLKHFMDFQIEVNTRKYKYLLEKELAKKEIQEGLITAVDLIDLIIEIIRGSKTQAQAKAALMGDATGVVFKHKSSEKAAKKLCFTERQAQAILDLRLAKLIGLEILALNEEYKETCSKIARYEKILKDPMTMLKVIKDELTKIQKEFSRERRTVITSLEQAQEVKEELKEEDVLFLMDRFGYSKVVDVAALDRNPDLTKDYRYSFICKNTSRVQMFTDKGKMHQVKVLDVPFQKPKDKGTPIDNLSNYSSSEEQILFVCCIDSHPEESLIFLTEQGLSKQVSVDEYVTNMKSVQATKLNDGDQLVYVGFPEKKQIILATSTPAFIRFAVSDLNAAKKNTLGQKAVALGKDEVVRYVWQVTPGEDNEILYKEQSIEIKRIRLKAKGGRGQKMKL